MKSNGYVTSTAFVQGALLTFHMIQAYGGCLPFNVLNHEAHFYRSNKEVTRWLIKKSEYNKDPNYPQSSGL
ncbi:hypothetical protein MHB42_10320 [Lysinibacillus sp. FSL K6-0232]|uniref:hypothetical protein n=1 Tax=unclassified Lysinibacillus TaxID=2636778 RepID=UPI0030FD139E